ncbi:hypothetical protein Gotur_034519 [Gossypium turneri]
MLGAPIKISSSPSCCSSSENRKAIMLSPVCLDKSRSFQFLFSGSKLQCSKTLDIKQLSSAKFRVSRGSKFRVFCDSKDVKTIASSGRVFVPCWNEIHYLGRIEVFSHRI